MKTSNFLTCQIMATEDGYAMIPYSYQGFLYDWETALWPTDWKDDWTIYVRYRPTAQSSHKPETTQP